MRRLLSLPCSLVCLLAVSGCDKAPPPAASTDGVAPAAIAAADAKPAPTPAVVAKPPLIENAARLGMAGRIPQNAEFYFGTANLKTHREALVKTAFWKQIEAFSQDKSPAANDQTQSSPTAQLEKWQINDAFISIGAGASESMGWLKDFNHIYTEYTYLMMVAGYTGAGAGSTFDLDAILANAASYPGVLEKICSTLERAEVPPMMLGLRSDKPEDFLKLFDDPTVTSALLEQMNKEEANATPPADTDPAATDASGNANADAKTPADAAKTPTPEDSAKPAPVKPAAKPASSWLAKAKKDTVTTPQGDKFTVYEGTFGIWLTPEVRQQWLERIAKVVKEEPAKARITKTLDTLAAKKFVVAYGTCGDFAVFATGTDRSVLTFAPTPEQSLLAHPQFAFAQEHAAKNVAMLAFADGRTLTASHDDEPLTPMLRGAVNGLSTSPIFAPIAAKIQPKLAALEVAEKKLYAANFSTLSGVVWWQDGLHLDARGGYVPVGDALKRPLQFTKLLDTPNALIAADAHSTSDGTGRAFFEALMSLVYTSAGELIQAGIGGDQAKGMFMITDKLLLPAILEAYDASKDVYQKALGSESVMVVDVGGELPAMSGVPTQGPPPKVVRIASVHEIIDRPLLTSSWQRIETALDGAVKASPIPFELPKAVSSREGGVTSWFFPLPLSGTDVLPTVSLTDKIYVLGTSKSLNEKLVTSLIAPAEAPAATPAAPVGGIAPAENTGVLFRVSFKSLRDLLKSLGGSSLPGVNADSLMTTAQWLTPFEEMNGRFSQEGETLRTTLHWRIHDLSKKYD